MTEITKYLPEVFPWADSIHYFETIDSTNTHAKELAIQGAPNGTVLIADSQTGGRGRMGRSFHSPAGSGIYLSVILRPSCQAQQLMHLTCAAAVAACSAIQNACGIRPGIKWTNDLVIGERKLGGILTELSMKSDGRIDWAIIGIGINCCQNAEDFPEDIRHIATSLQASLNRNVDRWQVTASLILQLELMAQNLLSHRAETMQCYRQDCITTGKYISVIAGNQVRHGMALDIDDDGALIVDFPGSGQERVNSGEVSIRGMYGYIR